MFYFTSLSAAIIITIIITWCPLVLIWGVVFYSFTVFLRFSFSATLACLGLADRLFFFFHVRCIVIYLHSVFFLL